MEWFSVDKAGLAKLLEKKGKSFAIYELIQNCWDTAATKVEVTLTPVPNRAYADLEVRDDDPNGFKDLSHAFTLFAESEKKGDPTKRGRFNLGEKLVLALCEEAAILSTTGSVRFDKGGRHVLRSSLTKGSLFRGRIKMTRSELEEVSEGVAYLIPPIPTFFNGAQIATRKPLKQGTYQLPTEISDEEGVLRKSARQTLVSVYPRIGMDTPMLYEMGIPVVELGDGMRWHVDVQQKIPLNMDRDNVTPAYLRALQVCVGNLMQGHLDVDDVKSGWVGNILEDRLTEDSVIERIVDLRFGTKRASMDPSDPEANKALLNEGYTIVPGGALNRAQWGRVKELGLIPPSSRIKPSGVQYSENGRPERTIAPEAYTLGQKHLTGYVMELARRLLKKEIQVRLVSEITQPHSAWYGDSTVTFNVGRLGKAWFQDHIEDAHNQLIIHEFAHDKVHDHLTLEFSDEVGRLGVKLARQMFTEPDFFRVWRYEPN